MARLSTYRELPICVPDDIVAGPTVFTNPVAVDKAKMFEYYYRVRKWKIEFSGSYFFHVDDGIGGFDVDGNFSSEITLESNKTDEKDMACAPYFEEDDIAVNSGIVDYDGVTQNTDADVSLKVGMEYQIVDDETFLPQFWTSIDIGLTGFSPYLFIGMTGGGGTLSATQNFEASSFPAIANVFLGGFPISAETMTASYTITPVEWWEYDPGDGGGPVWDSADGSQLRDPYSC